MSDNIGEDVIEYERLKHEQKRINNKVENLGKAIAIFMEQEGADVTPELPLGGKIYLQKKVVYEYSPDIQVEEDKLKEAKRHEELNGKAARSEDSYIVYKKSR